MQKNIYGASTIMLDLGTLKDQRCLQLKTNSDKQLQAPWVLPVYRYNRGATTTEAMKLKVFVKHADRQLHLSVVDVMISTAHHNVRNQIG